MDVHNETIFAVDFNENLSPILFIQCCFLVLQPDFSIDGSSDPSVGLYIYMVSNEPSSLCCGPYIRSKVPWVHCRAIIAFVEGSDPFQWKGYLLAVALVLSCFGQSMAIHHSIFHTWQAMIRMRGALVSAIYRKVTDDHI